jgi:hypothetical protein
MTNPGTRLWIDAVCINQENLDEKATQVGVMRDVYSNAESTCVRLRPRSEDSDLAISFTEELLSIIPEFQTGKIERVTSDYSMISRRSSRVGCPRSLAGTAMVHSHLGYSRSSFGHSC